MIWPDASGPQPAHGPQCDSPRAPLDPAAPVPLDRRVALAWGRRRHDRWLERWMRPTEALARFYVDDVHGFGMLGERAAEEPSPLGTGGNGSVRHPGKTYDNVILVGGGSRALSAGLAYVACPSRSALPIIELRLAEHFKVCTQPAE